METVPTSANSSFPWPTLTHMLRDRAATMPRQRAFTFVTTGDGEETHLSYGELDRRARDVASLLARLGDQQGPRTVMVSFPTGFDFLVAFLGCLYAGAIAVPVRLPHPRRSRSMAATEGIAADSAASIGLTTPALGPILETTVPDVRWHAIEGFSSAEGPSEIAEPRGEDVAYLQYTSGSTSAPKGVVIRHRNVLANCRELTRHWGIGPKSRIFSWLPHFHDMGLVFGLLEPIYAGCLGIFMSPMAFAQRPIRWLEAVARYRVTHSCAPNFAYEVCSRVHEDQLAGLDLSSWQVATNGAEAVRADTIERFSRRLAPCAFSRNALCPGYGLAENTLMTTSSLPGVPAVVRSVDSAALQVGCFEPRIDGAPGTQLTSSGSIDGVDTHIRIVDPETRAPCGPREIGEIWLAGPSVSAGYWRRPGATAEKFEASMKGSNEGPFLRTGDLGAIADDELFVLGRMDDLIVIRGANHHPEDLELTLEPCHPALEPNGGAAFAVHRMEEPRLVVAHEVRRNALRRLDAEEVVRSMVAAVADAHELEVAAVVLLRPRTLPRTPSGKKQRHACRAGFYDGTLKTAATWIAPKLRGALAFGGVTDPQGSPAQCSPEPPVGGRAASNPGNGSRGRTTMERTQPVTSRPPVRTAEPSNAESKTDEATRVIRWLRDYAGRRLSSRLMDERRSMPPYVALDFGNRGVLSMVAPRRYGGLDLDHRGLARVLEQLAAIDLTLASFVSVNNALGIRPILRYASAETREEVLPILGSGRELAAFAMTEPGAGSNVRAISSRGLPDGQGGWTLRGTKVWSGSAAWAGFINTFVQLEDTAGAPVGITGFILRQGQPGLRMGPEALTMGLRAMVQNKVFLEGVRVSREDLLGEPGQGMAAAMDTMEFGRFCLSALSLGVLKRCLQLMARHAERRTVATGLLIANPVTLTRISDLTAAAGAVESLIRLVADRLDQGLTVPAELYCVCKTAGPEHAWRAADQLVQQMAGRGFIESNLAPQILRDTRILRIFEGPTEPMNAFVGSRLVHRPEELLAFLADELRQPSLGAKLEDAARRISERCSGPSSPFSEPSAARSWTYSQVGEVASYGILLAAVRHRLEIEKDLGPQLRRAEEWSERRFERRLAKALAVTPAEAVVLRADEAQALIAGYDADIGNVEQTLAGEERSVDELVRIDPAAGDPTAGGRQPAGPSRSEVADDSSGAADPMADQGPANDLVAWLAAWLADELDVPRESIRAENPFREFGMDSVTAQKMSNALEQQTGLDLPPTLIWDYPTLGELAVAVSALRPPTAAESAADRPRGGLSASSSEPEPDDLSLLAQVDHLPEDQLEDLLRSLSAEEERS